MPSCSVKNCTSRTSYSKNKDVTFYRFPKDPIIREQWLNVCDINETNIKVDSARICSNHFNTNCFVTKWTKSKLKNTPPKEVRQLKKDSIPSEMLTLQKKRKRMSQNNENITKNKKLKVRTSIPTYRELVQCIQKKETVQYMESEAAQNIDINLVEGETMQHMEPGAAQNIDINLVEGETVQHIEPGAAQNIDIERRAVQYIEKGNNPTKLDITKEIDTNQNVSMETLLIQLKKSEEENKKILKEKTILEQTNKQLSTDITKLQVQITKITKDKQMEAKAMTVNILQKIFTPGQIKKLMSSTTKKIKWSAEDIMSAISLRSQSSKAYKYLRDVKNIPLPCVTTLHNWIADFKVLPGILKDVINIMSSKGNNLSTIEKLTVLTFDELYISNKLDIERKQQKIYGPHKTCQVIMARGLFKNWRQPIYYDFDVNVSRNILFTIIQYLYDIGYIVVAVTCDMGPSNMKLWKELCIGINMPNNFKDKITDTEKKCFIMHPANNSLKIFFYADVPHLIKLARNNLLDSGFKTKGIYVNKQCLEELLTLNERDLKISHKLNRAHLDVKGVHRQNVKMAAQIFSNMNAMAIKWCGENGFLKSKEWKHTSDVLKLFNDWFDVFNSQLKYGKRSGSHAYGINVEKQNEIIHNMDEFIKEMRVGQKTSLMQFQKGILLCNQSLPEMFAHIQENYTSETFDVKYILTRRLNQDILENFFSYIRSMGGGYDHPTPVEIKNRLKWYILGKHSGHVVSRQKNTEGDNSCEMLINMTDVYNPDLNPIYPTDFTSDEEETDLIHIPQLTNITNTEREDIQKHNIQKEAVKVLNLSNYEPSSDEMKLIEDVERIISQDIVEKNALLYVAGYVAHRFRDRYDYLGVPTKNLPNPSNDWICMLSQGNCMYPSEKLQKVAEITDIEFLKFYNNSFSKEDKIFDKLTSIICTKINNCIPKEVVACLVRTRTHIRLRKMNKDIVQNNI